MKEAARMEGAHYEPSPKEIREAEESMEPWQRAASLARHEVMSHAEDFEAVGVRQEDIQKAAEIAGDRAKLEFEQKENEDPFRRIAKVVAQAAETAEEHQHANFMIENLESHRTELARQMRQHGLLEKSGDDLGRTLKSIGTARQDLVTGKYVVNLDHFIRTIDHRGPPPRFLERILRGLESLGSTQGLDSLESLPKPDYEKLKYPYFDSFFKLARGLPTIIDGVRLDVKVDHTKYYETGPRGEQKPIEANLHEIWFLLDMKNVKGVVNFPES